MSDTSWPPPLVWPRQPLTDGVVLLDRFRDGDVDRIVDACTDAASQRWLPLPAPYTPADARSYVESRQEAARIGNELSFAVRGAADGVLCGAVGLSLRGYRHQGDVGYWTSPDRRGRGWTARAVRLVVTHALTALPLRRVEILAAVGNGFSRAVAEAAGATFEGVRRRGMPAPDDGDAAVYSFIRSDVEEIA